MTGLPMSSQCPYGARMFVAQLSLPVLGVMLRGAPFVDTRRRECPWSSGILRGLDRAPLVPPEVLSALDGALTDRPGFGGSCAPGVDPVRSDPIHLAKLG